MSLDSFISTLQSNNISEIICLVTQLIITINTAYNLKKNKQQFPVKQLSPLLSLTALISFFLLNCISFITRIIQQQNDYYNPYYQNKSEGIYQKQQQYKFIGITNASQENCGQCRLYNHPQMIILAFLYNGLRQLPLVIFIVKTYRVCLCYKTKYQQQLSDNVIKLFSNQFKLLLLSIIITILFMIIGYLVFDNGTPYYGNLVFEFFCPKQSSVYDWIMTAFRFSAMAYVYIISIYTYNQLDFKRFLILIFILTNTQVILRLFLAFQDITKTTYHQFYYHSFIMNLFGTLIMFYYSTIKEQRNRPLSIPILQGFKAFIQTTLGFSVLMLYAKHLDKQNDNQRRKYVQGFEGYIQIDEIMMFAYDNEFQIKQSHIPTILSILTNVNLEQILRQLQDRQRLIQRCRRRQINVMQLRQLQNKLGQFCENKIFYEWRQTQSSKYLQTQFKNNGVINLRMSTLGIEL